MISGNKGMVNSIIKDNKNIIGDNIINVQQTYDLIRILEPLITEDLLALSKELNTSFLGLEYSIKTASSIYDKLERKNEKIKKINKINKSKILTFKPQKELLKMKDIIRYTQICNHDDIINKTKETITLLNNTGYQLSGCKNYFSNPYESTGYMGMHLNFITPYGQEIELQIHSKESFQAKQEGHILYEKIRAIGTPEQDKEKFQKEIFKVHESISKPKNYDTIFDMEFTEAEKQKLKEDLIKKLKIDLKEKTDEHIRSIVYTILKNGNCILHGFENTQSDGSIFVYRNNYKDMHYVASLTKDGIETGYHNAEKTEISIDKAFSIAQNSEKKHKEWMEEHFPNGELDDVNIDDQIMDHYDTLEEVIENLKYNEDNNENKINIEENIDNQEL